MNLLARIKRLEERLRPVDTALIMPNGSLLQVPGGAPLECLYEVLSARRENREPDHPYLPDILQSVGEIGGGLAQAVQMQYKLYQLINNPEPNRNMEDFEDD